MSVAGTITPAKTPRPWGLWSRQALALVRLEMRKIFRGKGAFLLILLPMLPILIFLGWALVPAQMAGFHDLPTATQAFADTFQFFILPIVIFVGCAIVFTSLFRKEVLDRSLHYLFLTPVRREVVAAGKFLAGLMATCILFTVSTTLSFMLLYLPQGPQVALNHLLAQYGLAHLAAYVGVTLMACLGYGAVFLALGLFFRNPFIPALILLGWEHFYLFLPPLLKKISVIHYLRSLCPVPAANESPFAILAEPTPPWLAIPGFLLVTAVVLLIAGARIRRTEVSYGSE